IVFRVKQQFQGSVTYSWRSATAGSTRLARQGGPPKAPKAPTASTSGASRNVTGSAGFSIQQRRQQVGESGRTGQSNGDAGERHPQAAARHHPEDIGGTRAQRHAN